MFPPTSLDNLGGCHRASTPHSDTESSDEDDDVSDHDLTPCNPSPNMSQLLGKIILFLYFPEDLVKIHSFIHGFFTLVQKISFKNRKNLFRKVYVLKNRTKILKRLSIFLDK